MFDALDTQIRQTRLPNQLLIQDHSSYAHHTSRLFHPAFLRVPGPIRKPTLMDTAELGPLRLIHSRNAFDVDIEAPAFQRRAVLHVPLRGSFYLRSGSERAVITPGTLLLVLPGHDVSLSFCGGNDFLVVQLPYRALASASMDGTFGQGFGALGTGHLINQAPPGADSLMALLAYLFFEAGQPRRSDDLDALGHAMVDILAQRVVRCFGAPLPAPMQSIDSPLLAQARRFMMSDPVTGAPSIADLADHMGLSMRALQRRFAKETGQSPQAWLLGARLDRVQLGLKGGEHPTVTDAAFANGFQDLGRFAQHYRQRFGENPSATLRRAKAISVINES